MQADPSALNAVDEGCKPVNDSEVSSKSEPSSDSKPSHNGGFRWQENESSSDSDDSSDETKAAKKRKRKSTEHRQAKLKTKLRNALAEKYYPDCWTRVIPCKDKAPSACVAQNGRTMRLTAVNGSFYSFIGLKRVESDKHPFGVPDYYLLHESEFSVTTKDHWNREDLESGWYMYERTETDMLWLIYIYAYKPPYPCISMRL